MKTGLQTTNVTVDMNTIPGSLIGGDQANNIQGIYKNTEPYSVHSATSITYIRQKFHFPTRPVLLNAKVTVIVPTLRCQSRIRINHNGTYLPSKDIIFFAKPKILSLTGEPEDNTIIVTFMMDYFPDNYEETSSPTAFGISGYMMGVHQPQKLVSEIIGEESQKHIVREEGIRESRSLINHKENDTTETFTMNISNKTKSTLITRLRNLFKNKKGDL